MMVFSFYVSVDCCKCLFEMLVFVYEERKRYICMVFGIVCLTKARCCNIRQHPKKKLEKTRFLTPVRCRILSHSIFIVL